MSAGNVIPGARMSPRIANGCICWYEGDTFSLVLRMELEDQDGADVTIGESDTVKVTFRDRTEQTVQEFSFESVAENSVTLEFTDEVTGKFPRGVYTYDILYTHGDRTTLASRNIARVE